MSNLMDITLSAMNNNKYLIAIVPAVGISISLGSRIVLGLMGLGCKIASKVNEVVGNKFLDKLISKGAETAGDELLFRATTDFKRELKIGATLAALTAAGIGVSVLLEQPEYAAWKEFVKVDELKAFAKPYLKTLETTIEQAKPIVHENYNYAIAWTKAKLASLQEQYISLIPTSN